MNLSSVPISKRLHITFFGCTNVGKSSLINAFCNQDLSIVSEISGTTTDPVKKTMELLPLGPVVVFDTAGYDDIGELGQLRISKTLEILRKTDIAILVVEAKKGLAKKDKEFIEIFKKQNIPYVVAYSKADLIENSFGEIPETKENEIYVSAKNKTNIDELKNLVANLKPQNSADKTIIVDKLEKNDIVILNIPIDSSAPKGRLILPQQLVLRELLDNNFIVICTQTNDLKRTIDILKTKPKLVITDSQAFGEVKNIISNDILLTSFSILFARYKGNLETLIKGLGAIALLKNNSKILISEGCTHHRQCGDIGSVKIPKWLQDYTKKDFDFEFSSGDSFLKDGKNYDLIIHCGACMLNEKEMASRLKIASERKIPITNYGMMIALTTGILDRALEIFPEIKALIKKL